MSNELAYWDRSVELSIIPEGGGTAVTYRDLRVQFSIEKTLSSSNNTARIAVYNLNAASRQRLRGQDSIIRLKGGYNGNLALLFEGDLVRSFHKRDGGTWVSELECSTGARAFRDGKLSKTFKSGTSRRTVVKQVAASFADTSVGTLASTTLDRSLTAPLSVVGPGKRILNSLADDWGFRWSVQDNVVQVLDYGSRKSDTVAIKLSAGSGLIDYPVWTDDGLEVQSLLIPEIVPGRLLDVESSTESGVFQPTKVTHTGDSHGQEWNTICICTEAN